MTEEKTIEEAQITRLANFIRNLCNMRYPVSFILDKAFAFAVRMQYEAAYQNTIDRTLEIRAMSTYQSDRDCIRPAGDPLEIKMDETCTVWMEEAVTQLEAAIYSDNKLYAYLYGEAR